MKKKMSLLKEMAEIIISGFSNDKLNIENMYFLISEQVNSNQVITIEDVKSIYSSAIFEKIKEVIIIEEVHYDVISYIVKNKHERLTISYFGGNMICQIRYEINKGLEDKVNILTYNNTDVIISEDSVSRGSSKFIIEIKRSLSDVKYNIVSNLSDNRDSCSMRTYIEASSIYEQKELYSELR